MWTLKTTTTTTTITTRILKEVDNHSRNDIEITGLRKQQQQQLPQ
jgi:hypothetical protein